MTELGQTFQRQVLLLNIFITRDDECRVLMKVPLSQETEDVYSHLGFCSVLLRCYC